MKYFGRILLSVIASAVLIQAAYLKNVSKKLIQPDGTELHCYASGDEFHHWLHDKEGYLITRHSLNGFWVYGEYENGVLKASDLIAGRDDPSKLNLSKSVRPDLQGIREKRLYHRETLELNPDYAAAGTGFLNNIVIFIRFSDQEEFPEPLAEYSERFNTADISLKKYYQEASYGQLELNTFFYPPGSRGAVASYRDSHPRAYYEPYDAVTNPGGYTDDQYTSREQSLLANAVQAVRNDIPSDLDLDSDRDGYVDNVCFIIQGGEDGWSDLLWPHMWVLFNENVSINGKRVWTYNFNLSEFGGRSGMNVGVVVHEMFHSLGAPDLYHYEDDGMTPAGAWDLMEENGDPPHHMLAYMKYRYGGWIRDIPVLDKPGRYTLNVLTDGFNPAYRINSPFSSDEYFMVEYRRREGNYELTIPGTGLIVYRIDRRQDGWGNADGPPDEVWIYRPGGSPDANGIISRAFLSEESGRTEVGPDSEIFPHLRDGSWGGLHIRNVGSSLDSTISFELLFEGMPELPDLEAGSLCSSWEYPAVLSVAAGEVRRDSSLHEEGLLYTGDYYINSVISNMGLADMEFPMDRSLWRLYLDGELLQDWGSWQDSSRAGSLLKTSGGSTLFAWTPAQDGPLSSEAGDSLIFESSFSSDFPGPWQLNDYSGSGIQWALVNDSLSLDGSSAALLPDSLNSIESGLLSPTLDLSLSTDRQVLLEFLQKEGNPQQPGQHQIRFWTDDTVYASLDLDTAASEWSPALVDLSGFLGRSSMRFEFLYTGENAGSWFIDSVKVRLLDSEAVFRLSSGDCLEGFAAESVFLSEGYHQIELLIDPDGLLEELNGTNNSYSRRFYVFGPVGLQDEGSLPGELILAQNSPNPFNPETEIRYSLPEETDLQIRIIDIRGAERARIFSGRQKAGNYRIHFRPEQWDLPSGLYFYRIQTESGSRVKKLLYLK